MLTIASASSVIIKKVSTLNIQVVLVHDGSNNTPFPSFQMKHHQLNCAINTTTWSYNSKQKTLQLIYHFSLDKLIASGGDDG